MMISLLLGVLLNDFPQQDINFSHIQIPQEQVVWQSLPESDSRRFRAPQKKIINGKESLGIELSARSAIVVDVKSGKVLFKKDYEKPGSIASITKLMSALVFLDSNPKWDEQIILEERDERTGASPHIYRGEVVSLKDLFYTSLVSSDNNSTMALVRASNLSQSAFVQKMNDKAVELGLTNTYFVDPTGLNEGNISTALDISRLIYHAIQDKNIAKATTHSAYTITILNKNTKRRIYNTDQLLDSYINRTYKIKGGKTGFTYEAGSCLGVVVDDKNGNEIIVVVMGSKDNQHRFNEVKGLTQWAFDNFEWN